VGPLMRRHQKREPRKIQIVSIFGSFLQYRAFMHGSPAEHEIFTDPRASLKIDPSINLGKYFQTDVEGTELHPGQ